MVQREKSKYFKMNRSTKRYFLKLFSSCVHFQLVAFFREPLIYTHTIPGRVWLIIRCKILSRQSRQLNCVLI